MYVATMFEGNEEGVLKMLLPISYRAYGSCSLLFTWRIPLTCILFSFLPFFLLLIHADLGIVLYVVVIIVCFFFSAAPFGFGFGRVSRRFGSVARSFFQSK